MKWELFLRDKLQYLNLFEASDGKFQLSVTHPSLFNIFIHDLEKGVSNTDLKSMEEIKMEGICKHW